LTAKFSFDVTKYVFKNRHIMYDDAGGTPQNFDLASLCCWCIFQPAIGALSPVFAGVPPAVTYVSPQVSYYTVLRHVRGRVSMLHAGMCALNRKPAPIGYYTEPGCYGGVPRVAQHGAQG
jgi:hypothetical protein